MWIFVVVFGLQEFFMYLRERKTLWAHMLRVKQRLLGTEKWQFKSELTSVDGTALSLVWGFVGFFSVLFPCSACRECRWGEVWLFLIMWLILIILMVWILPKAEMAQEGMRALLSLPFRTHLQYVIIFSLPELWNYSGHCIFIFIFISPFTPVVFLECLTTSFFFFPFIYFSGNGSKDIWRS